MKTKLYCIFAKESIDKMKGIRGKMCAQAGHAFVHAVWESEKNFPELLDKYQNSDHSYKITLVTDTVEHLKKLHSAYKSICGTSLIVDAGFTVLDEPTTTCLGIGPITEDMIGDDIKTLKTFS